MSSDYNDKTIPENSIDYWLNEISQAKKRSEDYWRDGKRIIDIYSGIGTNIPPFNILFSNTDTQLPALYSSTPRPIVQRRYKDDDPMGRAVADASTRMLEFLSDSGIEDYPSINDSMMRAVIDGLLPGRGVTKIKYMAKDESEYVCTEAVDWDKFICGYASCWNDVAWIGFCEIIDKQESLRLFGEAVTSKITFMADGDNNKDTNSGAVSNDKNQGGRKTAAIYQIWDKTGGRKVRYVYPQYQDDFLLVIDDPMEISGFYPIPKPMQFIYKSGTIVVTPLYLIYENQAKELNDLTIRINRLIKAIKAKGVYDAELGSDIENLLTGDDNTFIPADKSALLAAERGFDNAIWFLPIEKMVMVLRELYAAREQCKQVIYEVTGISDIIRGATVASETASAQTLKSQWGTMRLKSNQSIVQDYARSLYRIMLEVAANQMSIDSWAAITQLPYATDKQIMQAKGIMQAIQSMQASQPPAFDDQGNPMAQQLPEMAQKELQKANEILNAPSWSQVLEFLKNDSTRSYRVDIETNSTVIPEAVEDQKNIAEVMGALGKYLEGVMPLVQSGSMPFQSAQAMMLAVVRRYQFGSEIEDEIKAMQPPPPPPSPPEPVDTSEADLQAKQMELQAKQQSEQMALQAKQQDDAIKMQADMHKEQENNALELQKIESNIEIERMRIESQFQLEQMRIDSAERKCMLEAQTKNDVEQIKCDHEAMQLQMSLDTQLQMSRDRENMDMDRDDRGNNDAMMDAIDTLIEQLNKPKEIIRGPDGRVIGIQ